MENSLCLSGYIKEDQTPNLNLKKEGGSMGKIVFFALIVVVGGGITAGIDVILGIQFETIGLVQEIIHKATYMIWGLISVDTLRWLFPKE